MCEGLFSEVPMPSHVNMYLRLSTRESLSHAVSKGWKRSYVQREGCISHLHTCDKIFDHFLGVRDFMTLLRVASCNDTPSSEFCL